VAVKTTKITLETESLVIVRRGKAGRAWCPDCRAEADVITLAEGLAEPTTAAQLQTWLETGNLHLWQPALGPAQICVTSLLRCFELEQVRKLFGSKEISIDWRQQK